MDRLRRKQQTQLDDCSTRRGVPVYGNLKKSWVKQRNNYREGRRNSASSRRYKFLLTIAIAFASPAQAETIGGVSATAAPSATSSGSVTNMAIQNTPGSAFSNTYGSGIRCQGPVLSVTPWINRSKSFQFPFESYYDEPVYDLSDIDEDGYIDNPGQVLYTMPQRTGQKDTHSWAGGLSIQATIPLDGGLQERCKAMVDANIKLHKQAVETRRLEYELFRLKSCTTEKLRGANFHPRSPYYAICADVVINPKPVQVLPHKHAISAQSAVPASSQTRLQVEPFGQAKP